MKINMFIPKNEYQAHALRELKAVGFLREDSNTGQLLVTKTVFDLLGLLGNLGDDEKSIMNIDTMVISLFSTLSAWQLLSPLTGS